MSDTLGRVVAVSPLAKETYYLRMLLPHSPGCTSFEDLRTHDNEICETFKEKCQKLNLLNDGKEWEHCLDEAIVVNSGYKLRYLFAIILTECNPSNPVSLWEKYTHMCFVSAVLNHGKKYNLTKNTNTILCTKMNLVLI